MKKIVALTFLLLPSFIFAQEWSHIYDNSTTTMKLVYSINMAYDSGYYLHQYLGSDNIVLSKTDNNGYISWTKKFSYSVSDYFSRGRITTDNMGNVYYAGSVLCETDTNRTAILKINCCGEYEWCRLINIPYDLFNYGEDIHIMQNNDLLVHTRYIGDHSVEKEQIVRFNEYGDLLWINQILPEYETPKFINLYFETMIINNEGEAYMAGTVYMQDAASGNEYWYPKGILVKLDEFGNEEFVSIFDYADSNDCIVFKFALETESEIICNGYDYVIDSAGNVKPTPTICSFDKYTGELHDRSIQHLNEDIPNGFGCGLMEVNNGIFSVHCIGIPGTQKNMLQIELLDESYNGIDSVLFDDRISHYDVSNLVCKDTSMIITGHEWVNPLTSGRTKGMAMKVRQDLSIDTISNIQLNYDTLCPYTIEDEEYECDCYQAFYVGIENNKVITLKDLTGLKAYPNPATDNHITFETKTISKNRTVQIYNLEGSLVKELGFPQRSTTMEVTTKNFDPGAYIAKLIIEGKKTDFIKFIIQ